MNLPYILTCVGLMALVTYLPRMIPLVFMNRKIKNRFIQSFLHYVPYAVLAAMTFPDIFTSAMNPVSSIAGLCAALLLAWRRKSLLTVALGASGIAFLTYQAMLLFASH